MEDNNNSSEEKAKRKIELRYKEYEKNKIDRLLREGIIDKKTAEEYKDEFLELSTEKQDKINEPIITERKIQEKILRNLEKMEITNKSIKRNVQYFFWVSIISIISTIIVLFG